MHSEHDILPTVITFWALPWSFVSTLSCYHLTSPGSSFPALLLPCPFLCLHHQTRSLPSLCHKVGSLPPGHITRLHLCAQVGFPVRAPAEGWDRRGRNSSTWSPAEEKSWPLPVPGGFSILLPPSPCPCLRTLSLPSALLSCPFQWPWLPSKTD